MKLNILKRAGMLAASTAVCCGVVFGGLSMNGLRYVRPTAENWTFLGNVYPTPAYDTEIIRVYLATGLSFGSQHLDPGEFLNVVPVPLSDLYRAVMNGEIADAKTQIGVLKTVCLAREGQLSVKIEL